MPHEKKAEKIKPVLLTLAVAVIILLSAIAPQLIFTWQDKDRLDRITPIQRNLVSLSDNNASSYRDLLLNTPVENFTQSHETTDTAEIRQTITQILLPKIDELVEAGLVPNELFAYSENIAEMENIRLTLFESTADGYARLKYSITDERGTWLNVCFDSASGKITAFETYSPETQQFSAAPADYMAIFERYINWLGVGALDDWAVQLEDGTGGGVVYSVIGISAGHGLSAHLYFYNADDGFGYRLLMEKLN